MSLEIWRLINLYPLIACYSYNKLIKIGMIWITCFISTQRVTKYLSFLKWKFNLKNYRDSFNERNVLLTQILFNASHLTSLFLSSRILAIFHFLKVSKETFNIISNCIDFRSKLKKKKKQIGKIRNRFNNNGFVRANF